MAKDPGRQALLKAETARLTRRVTQLEAQCLETGKKFRESEATLHQVAKQRDHQAARANAVLALARSLIEGVNMLCIGSHTNLSEVENAHRKAAAEERG